MCVSELKDYISTSFSPDKADAVCIFFGLFEYLWYVLDFEKDNVIVCVCQSTDADYDRVPVEDYGLAMLKGMGWKKTEGIGRTFKQ